MKRFLLSTTIAGLVLLGGCDKPLQEEAAGGDSSAGSVDNGDGSGSGPNGSGSSPGSTTPGSPNFNSALFFEKTVSPTFKGMCEGCHVGPRVAVPKRGPQTIYSFQAMEPKLKSAKSLEESDLWMKMTNKVAHTAGDVCGGNPEQSPCKEVADWYKGIFGSIGEGAFGGISNARYDGTLSGWGINPSAKAEFVEVEIYVGGPFDQGGKLITKVKADKGGFDNGNGATHAFTIDVPDAMITHGKAQPFYAYAIIGTEKKLFAKMPFSATMYVPKAKAFFDANIAGSLGGCAGCHGPASYESWYPRLIAPLPTDGGSPTNNRLSIVGCAGTGHPAGGGCGGATNNVQTWWNMEFGP